MRYLSSSVTCLLAHLLEQQGVAVLTLNNVDLFFFCIHFWCPGAPSPSPSSSRNMTTFDLLVVNGGGAFTVLHSHQFTPNVSDSPREQEVEVEEDGLDVEYF